jgi:hypothetical protein
MRDKWGRTLMIDLKIRDKRAGIEMGHTLENLSGGGSPRQGFKTAGEISAD